MIQKSETLEVIDEKLCTERMGYQQKQLDDHKKILDQHGIDIGNLKDFRSRSEVQIDNLCKQIGSLVKAIWWFITLAGASLLGFFIWYIQSLPRA